MSNKTASLARVIEHVEPQLDAQLFTAMLRIRMIEEEIAARYAQEKMRCPIHLSIGQEAVAVGVSSVLRRSDQIVTTHRCHAHYLAKGGDLKAMLCELMGREPGCCSGRGGSMHLFDREAGVLIATESGRRALDHDGIIDGLVTLIVAPPPLLEPLTALLESARRLVLKRSLDR